MKKYQFSWGETYCIREILQRVYPIAKLQRPEALLYSPDYGNEELINLLWEYILKTTDMPYKHIIVTPGCIPAVNISMRVLAKHRGFVDVSTHYDSFYYYTNMIEKAGLNNIKYCHDKSIGISDSPSNPYGTYCNLAEQNNNIWDSVYYSPVFINGFHMPPGHIINCGSVSKSLGLTGLRIGFIATNDDNLAHKLRYEVKYEYCTVSTLAQLYLVDLFKNINLDNFFTLAKGSINYNREEISKLEYILGSPTPTCGMFYVGNMDKSAESLFNAAGVEWTVLPSGKVRFSLAQNNTLTKEMVSTILKLDGK
jgi:aspartate/methionine/tyrosine aminotransferase